MAASVYYYEGGFDEKELESSYTLTHFYLAQAYTKLGFKDKARRVSAEEHFSASSRQKHLSSVSSFAISSASQNTIKGIKCSLRLNTCCCWGLKLLPEGGKKKSHANLYISLGNMLRDLLDFCCRHIRSQQPFEANADDIISRKIF
jgi:hypothetical protein